jgi:hypothetical protein
MTLLAFRNISKVEFLFLNSEEKISKIFAFRNLVQFFLYLQLFHIFCGVSSKGMAHGAGETGQVIKSLSILYVFAGLSHDLLLGLCGMCSSILFLSDVAPCLPSRRHLLRDPLGGCLFSGSFNGPGHQHPHLCARACSQKFPPRHSSRAPHG